MYCFVILLLFNEMQMSVRRFSAIPHLRAISSLLCLFRFGYGFEVELELEDLSARFDMSTRTDWLQSSLTRCCVV